MTNEAIAEYEIEEKEVRLNPREFEQEQEDLDKEPEYQHLLKLAVELGIEI